MTLTTARRTEEQTSVPLVSIVIPAYNQAEYLHEAIRSVLAQSYPKIELIVLDDGSTDGTLRVLDDYSGKLHWETQQNMGQALTLNKGWAMANGQYLSYLAADDFLLPDAVKLSIAKLLANPEVVLTYCDYNIVDSQARLLRTKHTPEFSYADLAVRLICQPGPGVFFRRDAFERAGHWNGSLRQVPDLEFWLRLGLEGSFERIPRVLAAYRAHSQSQSYGPVEYGRAEEIVHVVSAHFRCGRLPAPIAKAQSEALSTAHIVAARHHLRSGRYLMALNHLQDAFKASPCIYLRVRTWWLVASGLLNRIGYKCLGQIGKIFPRPNRQRSS